jgi:tetratricopeptide (TPR) repeat protein
LASSPPSKSNPKSNPKSKKVEKRVRRRLNKKALWTLGGIIVLAGLLTIPVKILGGRGVRGSALAQAKESSEKGDVDLALRHLDRYLAGAPNDVPVLEAKAKLLAEASRSTDRWLLMAAQVHDRLLRLDPDGEGRLETRRTLANLYIRYTDGVRQFRGVRYDDNQEAKDSRYPAAVAVLQTLLKIEDARGIKDAVAHRLLALAYMGQASGVDSKSADVKNIPQFLADAKAELEKAIAIDPRDLAASEKLAELYLTRLNDPASAEKTLDALLEAMPGSVDVRLARYRVFSQSKDKEKADRPRLEIEAAVKLAPDNVLLRTLAADIALRRGDVAEARRHLDALPANVQKENLRVRVLRGNLEFLQDHPDEAIDQWRQGLSLVGGGDIELTWRLAYSLIRLGGSRLGEAEPLITRYFQMVGEDRKGMGLFLRAMYDQRAGHVDKAIKKLEKALKVLPTEMIPEAQMLLGRCQESIGDKRAMAAYQAAAKAAPQSPGPRREIARLLLAEDPERAATELELALAQNPDDPGLLMDLARLRIVQEMRLPREQRRWRVVENLLARAEKVAPNDMTLRNLRAGYLGVTSQVDRAVKELADAARGVDRHKPEAWLAWAGLLDRTNRQDEAMKILDQGMAPDAAGDHAMLRIAKARILVRAGRGQAAREVLSKDRSTVPSGEQAELSQAMGNLLHELGDRDGARASFAEWARLAPESPSPALTLLALAQADGDDEAARLGLDALRSLGGDKDPYGMAAQALELLRTSPSRPGPPPADRLERAERLVALLQQDAPELPVGYLIQGMILEFRGNLAEAAKVYEKAIRDNTISPALPRLIEVYMTSKQHDKLDELKRRYDEAAAHRQSGLAIDFARISADVARRTGNKEQFDYFLTRVVDAQPDSVESRINQARLLVAQGKTTEAEARLQELVAKKPQEKSGWLNLIDFLVKNATPARAAQAIEQARARFDGDRPELFLAQCYWVAGDKPKAIAAYQKAVEKRPDDLETLRSLVEFRSATGQDDAVEPVLRKVLKLDANASWAAKLLALRISAKGDPATWPEAWSLVSSGSLGSSEIPEDRLIRATVLARSPEVAQRAESIPAFVALVKDLPISNPLAIDARTRLSQAMLEINQVADAWTYIAPLADDLTKPNPNALVIAIEALSRMGKADEAEKRLDRLIQLAPNSPQTALSKAWFHMAKGQKAEASATLKSAFDAAEATPEGEFVGSSALELLMKFGDHETGLKVARPLAARWPRDAWMLARVQVARKEYDDALASCRIALDAGSAREALRHATSSAIARRDDPAFVKQVEALGETARTRSPGDPGIQVFLATVRHIQGRYEDELACYRRALELNPNTFEFLNNMAWTLCEGLNQPQEALKRIDEAISRAGEAAQFLDTRGVILGRLGKLDQAIVDLEKSVKAMPVATTYFHLARAYLKAKKPEESRRCRDLARKGKFDPKELDPTDRADLAEVMGKDSP